MIKLSIIREGRTVILPVNPERIEPEREGSNQTVNIISLGEVVIPGEPGLASYSIESYFPAELEPETYVKFIEGWWNSKKPARFVGEGLGIDSLVTVDKFVPIRKAGEEFDIYYSLVLKQYRPYGAKIVQIKAVTTPTAVPSASPTAPSRVDTKPPVQQTYTVKSGDTLWAIAKRLSNKGGTDWGELYAIEANKQVIGNNPNLIRVGQVLIVPSNWVTPSTTPVSTPKASNLTATAGSSSSATSAVYGGGVSGTEGVGREQATTKGAGRRVSGTTSGGSTSGTSGAGRNV